MRILSITVGGFRNIEKTTFELGGIVGLVSANNYGKTNVLELSPLQSILCRRAFANVRT